MDQAKLDKLVENREKAMAGGGEAAVEKHHATQRAVIPAVSVLTCCSMKVRLRK